MPKKKVIKKSALAPTVLIAGGAGFIGSHLAEAMLLKGARVIVLDNFNTGKEIYIHSLLDNKNFALYDVNINEGLPKDIESVDYIFHLAGLEEYLYNKEDVNLDSLLTNALGTKNLLDLAKKSPAKFLLVSSIDVYQALISPVNLDHYFGPTTEEEKKYSLIEAKRYAEALVWEFYKRNQVDARIVRLPEIYGPRMNVDASGNLGRALKELLDNKDLTVYGDGTEKEYYTYISDAISGIIKALFKENTTGKIFSLVENEPFATLETIYLLKSLSNIETQVVFKDATTKSPIQESKVSDRTNLASIGWEPKINIKEGLVKTLGWFNYTINENSKKTNKLIEDKSEELKTKVLPEIAINTINKGNDRFNNNLSTTTEPKKEEISQIASLNEQKVENTEKPINNVVKTVSKAQFLEKPSYKEKFSKLKVVKYLIPAFVALILVFVAVPSLQTYFYVKKAYAELNNIQTNILALETEKARDSANLGYVNLIKAQRSLKKMGWMFSVTGKKELHQNSQHLISSATHFSRASYFISKGLNPYENFWQIIKPNSEESFDLNAVNESHLDFMQSQDDIQRAIAEYKNVNSTVFPDKFKSKVQMYENALDLAFEHMNVVTPVVENFSTLAGLSEPQRYLILLQNNNELRATGGFIGSYAILEMHKGKIAELTIDDIYNPDGQIDIRNIAVEPPAPIKEFLNEEVLHIRNANWDPDFRKSADTIQNLFFRLTGEKFDGIFALDLFMAKNILDATGPVFLTAYNEEITSENVYEKAEFYSEFNYTDGSDQKRAFLTVLGGKLMEKMFSLPKEEIPALLTVFQTALDEKHLLLTLPNNPLKEVLNQNSWDGSLVNTKGDYLFVVNSNVGGTKANYYMKNNANYSVKSQTRDGLLRSELVLNYENTGTDTWPSGPYTNYLRVLVQNGSKLTGATLTQSDGTQVDILEEVLTTESGQYVSFEKDFVVDPQSKAQITLKYDLPTNLSISDVNKDYSLYWQKQPGTQDQYDFLFDVPFGMDVAKIEGGLESNNGVLTNKGTFIKDLNFEVGLK